MMELIWSRDTTIQVYMEDGVLVCDRINPAAGFCSQGWSAVVERVNPTLRGWRWQPFGARFPSWDQDGQFIEVNLYLPFWTTLGLTAFVFQRGRRVPLGHCRKCHYDLTGITVDVCPECGTVLPTS